MNRQQFLSCFCVGLVPFEPKSLTLTTASTVFGIAPKGAYLNTMHPIENINKEHWVKWNRWDEVKPEFLRQIIAIRKGRPNDADITILLPDCGYPESKVSRDREAKNPIIFWAYAPKEIMMNELRPYD